MLSGSVVLLLLPAIQQSPQGMVHDVIPLQRSKKLSSRMCMEAEGSCVSPDQTGAEELDQAPPGSHRGQPGCFWPCHPQPGSIRRWQRAGAAPCRLLLIQVGGSEPVQREFTNWPSQASPASARQVCAADSATAAPCVFLLSTLGPNPSHCQATLCWEASRS